MTPPPFLETNILVRHLTGDEPNQSPRATALLAKIARGEVSVHTTDTVVFEIVFTLQRFYKVPRSRIRDEVLPLIELSGVLLAGKQRYRDVFDLYVSEATLSFADSYHAVVAKQMGLTEIYSFARGFDRVPGLTRIEP